jgi:hypothetical protein
MLEDVTSVLANQKSIQTELSLDDQRVLRVAITPYSYNDVKRSQGVAITFNDISKVEYTEAAMPKKNKKK